jgi:Na+-transporting methylmalonyl-CoA/oxaloacetate decarboxylase gamma subunit
MKELIPFLVLLAILMSPPLIGRLMERWKPRKKASPKSSHDEKSQQRSGSERTLTALGKTL